METFEQGWRKAATKKARIEPFTYTLVATDKREVAVSGDVLWKNSPLLWDMIRLDKEKRLAVDLCSESLYATCDFWYSGQEFPADLDIVEIAEFAHKFGVTSLDAELARVLTCDKDKPLAFFSEMYSKCSLHKPLRQAALRVLVKSQGVTEAVEKYGALVASEDAYLLFENVPHDIGGVNLQSYISYLKTWVDRKEDPSGLSCCVEGITKMLRAHLQNGNAITRMSNFKKCIRLWKDLSYTIHNEARTEKCAMSSMLSAAAANILE